MLNTDFLHQYSLMGTTLRAAPNQSCLLICFDLDLDLPYSQGHD